jgi:acyl-CoA synthetase (AMP-forming)/AMP-acid ligase II
VQVSPKEIEDVLLAQPEKLITDVSVAGVSGGRTSDEKVPCAWIVLSAAGTKKGEAAVIKILEAWHQKALSKYKWLRGGIEVVKEVRRSAPASYLLRAKVELTRRPDPENAYREDYAAGAAGSVRAAR